MCRRCLPYGSEWNYRRYRKQHRKWKRHFEAAGLHWQNQGTEDRWTFKDTRDAMDWAMNKHRTARCMFPKTD